jgi:NAD(P)-dependent dehydrogenase (short-subunit alcohol dehydrogenase family)
MIEIKEKTAIITGGSKGIGYGVAESLIDEGMNVAITSNYCSFFLYFDHFF